MPKACCPFCSAPRRKQYDGVPYAAYKCGTSQTNIRKNGGYQRSWACVELDKKDAIISQCFVMPKDTPAPYIGLRSSRFDELRSRD